MAREETIGSEKRMTEISEGKKLGENESWWRKKKKTTSQRQTQLSSVKSPPSSTAR